MKLIYISPSEVPSRAANSVHVVMQCEALINKGVDVVLYVRRTIPKDEDLPNAILSAYGVDLCKARIVSFYSRFKFATNLRIAVKAFWDVVRRKCPDAIISRNIYASFLIGVMMRRPVLFETHQLEPGFYKFLQREIISCPWVTTIVISNKLSELLVKHHGIRPSKTIILHDAAPNKIKPFPSSKRRSDLKQLLPEINVNWKCICGYFGHLYPGRGIEIIEKLAKACPDVLFLVFGGSNADVNIRKNKNQDQINLFFGGHIDHPSCQAIMRSVDVLLMPYQNQVSIGTKGHDTARWMSPIKMFEYMASGVPLISSNLPVLREVLVNEYNSLLVPPEDYEEWVLALSRLIDDKNLSDSIGKQAHTDYKSMYTWEKRADSLIRILKSS